jgi:two-component system chemotaxis sensor kinase CheA
MAETCENSGRCEAPANVAAQPSAASLAQDRELVSDFIVESQEHLRAIEANLLKLEHDAGNAEAIHASFRGFHTIKGLAGFLEFGAVQEVAHEVETILDLARNGRLAITPDVNDVVLEASDYIERWIRALEATLDSGAIPEAADHRALLTRIRALAGAPDLATLADAVGSEEDAFPSGPRPEQRRLDGPPAQTAGRRPAENPGPNQSHEARAVKVDTAKLDHLVDMVGELVIAQSMIQHDPDLALLNRPRITRNLSQLSRITDEVQKTAMAMRMMPIGRLFQRMSRVIRDLARKTGKEVELEISGEDTELDRNLVEELADPLMHMLRNAMDHGVESPEERIARGKPARARVGLRAAHQSGKIVIQVSDDGRGLDRSKIVQKAIANGLITSADSLSDAEVYNLIFQPGFSTAERVTDVSGRGVGMDVVRKHVQKLRGRIEIESAPGKGATFHLRLPLTLAILDGLIVGVGGERYILPLFAVREMLRPAADTVFTVQDKGEVALVRGELLPLVRLYRRFGVTPKTEDVRGSLLIVAENSQRAFCVMVDHLIGKQEVVIKNLGAMLQHVPGVAGGAILGDGRVGLILDLDRVFDGAEAHSTNGRC